MKFRKEEMNYLNKKMGILNFNIASVWITPILIINVTFALYIFMGNSLTAEKAFTIISVFGVL